MIGHRDVITVTLGTFDGLHAGHVDLLTTAARMSADGQVRVALNSSGFVSRYKGVTPLHTWTARHDALRALPYVARVIPNGSECAKMPILELTRFAPATLVIGSDWHGDQYLTQLGVTWQWLHANNIVGITYVPRPVDGPSSTKLRAAAHAARLAQHKGD